MCIGEVCALDRCVSIRVVCILDGVYIREERCVYKREVWTRERCEY